MPRRPSVGALRQTGVMGFTRRGSIRTPVLPQEAPREFADAVLSLI
jgi:hypothetical protein